MSVQTRSQLLAQAAYARVTARKQAFKPELFKEYASFAKSFAALIHACGLVQAVAFAIAKRDKKKPGGGPQSAVADDLASVLSAGKHVNVANGDALAEETRNQSVPAYLRLSRDAIEAAVWLKRYVEALSEKEEADAKVHP